MTMREGIRRTLLGAGLPPENVMVEWVCTAHHRETFYSHRAEAGNAIGCGFVLDWLGQYAQPGLSQPTIAAVSATVLQLGNGHATTCSF